MNDTETRAMLKITTGHFAPRTHTTDQVAEQMATGCTPSTQQLRMRQQTQAYLARNWEYIKEVIPCDGDCASAQNLCTDVQASACYHDNLVQIRNG